MLLAARLPVAQRLLLLLTSALHNHCHVRADRLARFAALRHRGIRWDLLRWPAARIRVAPPSVRTLLLVFPAGRSRQSHRWDAQSRLARSPRPCQKCGCAPRSLPRWRRRLPIQVEPRRSSGTPYTRSPPDCLIVLAPAGGVPSEGSAGVAPAVRARAAGFGIQARCDAPGARRRTRATATGRVDPLPGRRTMTIWVLHRAVPTPRS
jgi:hypothetical protein